MTRRAGGTVAGVLALALTAACGTTVDLDRSAGPAAIRSTGTSAEPPAGSTTRDGAPGSVTADLEQGLPYGGRPGSRSVVPGGVDGPGVTASTLTFGVTYALDTGQANAAVGAGAVDPGDVREYYDAVVDEVNRSGGVAGRRLVPAYFETRTTSSESADSQRLAACEHWARDVKGFVVLDASSEAARSCAEQHGMLSFSSGGNATAATFRRFPHYLEPSGVALEDYESDTVLGLAKTDFYGTAPVIGVVTWDDPSFRSAVTTGMLPALASLGLEAEVVEYVDVAQTYAGAGSASASISSAILAFRRRGVTHVFIADGPSGVCQGTCLTLLWQRGASSQRYYPRYGLNDLNSPQKGIDAGFWGPEDLRGARAVTVNNAYDETDVGVARNPRRLACLALMKRHGLVADDAAAQGAMLVACDNIWFLRAVLGTVRATVDRDSFVARAELLGTGYRSPVSYRNEISPARHYGAAGYRRMALDDGCGCFRYTSGVYAS